MFSTVHAYLNLKKNERGLTLGKIESAIALKYPHLSMSDTKLSKLFKDPNSKVSIEELFAIVDCMGLDKMELLALIGEKEFRASQSVDYKGISELMADFQRREEALQLSFQKAEEAFTLAVDTISRRCDDEIQRVHENNLSCCKRLKYWRIAAVVGFSILSFAFLYLLWELMHIDQGATAILIQMVRDGVI